MLAGGRCARSYGLVSAGERALRTPAMNQECERQATLCFYEPMSMVLPWWGVPYQVSGWPWSLCLWHSKAIESGAQDGGRLRGCGLELWLLHCRCCP